MRGAPVAAAVVLLSVCCGAFGEAVDVFEKVAPGVVTLVALRDGLSNLNTPAFRGAAPGDRILGSGVAVAGAKRGAGPAAMTTTP